MSTSRGKCHICRRVTVIKYCDFCGHWLCHDCESDYIARGEEAIRELLRKLTGRSSRFCCGPSSLID